MHSLLARQIKRCMPESAMSEPVKQFIGLVDAAYQTFDADRMLSERSMEIASGELTSRNAELQGANTELHVAHADLRRLANELEERVRERTAELQSVNEELLVDIYVREQVEEALRRAEEDYRTMFESATVGIFQTTGDGNFLKCNPSLAAIYGYESPEELKQSVGNVKRDLYVDPDTRARFVEEIEKQGKLSGFEARVYRKDGSIIWISETARIVRDGEGKFLYYEGFVTDITARKCAEDSLRESEERYALAIRGANDGLWDWSLRDGQIYFSSRWKEMLGPAKMRSARCRRNGSSAFIPTMSNPLRPPSPRIAKE